MIPRTKSFNFFSILPILHFSRNPLHARERGGLKEQDLVAANDDDDGGFTVIVRVYN
ncbi:hypothetical protein HanRHA438_Chr13g0593871 [Helianthus annuus]|uniref:Uncharacterized protein n=1 Tax=Helianthus annuus TaxID=4232 RepID=A0A251SRG6_HELAN|nr:hypothetical protein HanXRQr2_Chr13g0583221 [Helianthus annuus]KAJ0476502.1 hypothetical protein HanHA300_Chr13g0478091 [Helianthus annuus]KAJ0480723.1 hypothetical protein HanIR_Chr13g0634891 [Helianthus annuus]KAJ0497329.1 hypothetical protein HanHA89_Chr13g0510201 [Helianthus annuus]KAJ0670843.1 hypothetical protein HanOQP8_Chr13g0479121 [Helianthus annuus]